MFYKNFTYTDKGPTVLLTRSGRGVAGRIVRDAEEKNEEEELMKKCEAFMKDEGDDEFHEFFSPGYPNNYPKNINCTRIIEGNFLMFS